MSESAAGWLAAGVRAEWIAAAAGGAPLRLNLTLTVPKPHNPQSPQLWRALRAVQREIPGSVRVVVIRGDGPSFSSGLDTGLLAATVAEPPGEADLAEFQRAFDWTSDVGYVSMAAVHGYALGAGLQLALGCDLRIVTADAVLGLPEVGHGLVPDLGGTGRLLRAVGYARALELAATGRRLHGRESYDLGLAQRVVEPDQLDAEVERLVTELLAPDRDAVREIKALLLGAASATPLEQLAAERAAQLRRFDALADRATES